MNQQARGTARHDASTARHTPRLAARARTAGAACLVALGWLAGCGGATTMGDGRSHSTEGDAGAGQAGSGGTGRQDSGGVPANPRCGDGTLDPGELCDGLQFPTTDCVLLSMAAVRTGKLHCTADCRIEFLACSDPTAGTPCDGTTCDGTTPPCTGPGPYPPGCVPPKVDSCAPQFCPTSGAGVGCCVTANGPCGVDYGMGCVAPSRDGGG